MLDNLELVSGVVCRICGSGLQCVRKASTGSGTLVLTFTQIPGATEQESGWKCEATYEGAYRVTCDPCPPVDDAR